MICPDCGTPLDEVPLARCKHHAAYAADEREAEERARRARPTSQKIEESQDFEELREHLRERFLQQGD